MEDQNQPVKHKSRVNKFLLVYFISTIVIFAAASVGFTTNISGVKDYYFSFRDHGPFGFAITKVIKELDLNATQKQEMEKIRDEIKAKMEQNKSKREDHFNEFGNLFKQDKLDKEQLLALASKYESQREEMKGFFAEQLVKVHAVLTPDQRSKAVEKLKEMKEKHKERRHKKAPDNQ